MVLSWRASDIACGRPVESWSTCDTNGTTSAATIAESRSRSERDDGRRGSPTETRLQPLDQRVESDREERRCQCPYEHVTHLARKVADERQASSPTTILATAARAHVDRDPAARGCRRIGYSGACRREPPGAADPR